MFYESKIPPVESLQELVGKNDGCITECFFARAARDPDRVFLMWQESTWSYRKASEQVLRFAGFVRSLPRDQKSDSLPRVASYLPNCPSAIWSWLGCSAAGQVFVPLNREHRGTVLEDMLQRSGATLLVTDSAGLDNLPAPECISKYGIRDLLIVDDDYSDLANLRVHTSTEVSNANLVDPLPCLPTDPACIMFSSGTTGRSKAVMVPHNQYCRGAGRLVDAFKFVQEDVFHNWLPLFHLGGQLHMTMTAILCGGSVALFPTFSRSNFQKEVTEVNATIICGMSTLAHLLMSLPESSWDKSNSLRAAIIAGVPSGLHQKMEERFGLQILENYGMTECDPVTHTYLDCEGPTGNCGRASADIKLAILGDHGQALPPGEVGEIAFKPVVAGLMALGYENDKDAYEASFRDGWFLSGDFGRLDTSGYLYYIGRRSHFIRRRGENISCDELQSLISRYPGVKECVAIGVPSELGEDDVKVVLVVKDRDMFDDKTFANWCQNNMARFMIPRWLELRDELPVNKMGKILSGELKNNTQNTIDMSK